MRDAFFAILLAAWSPLAVHSQELSPSPFFEGAAHGTAPVPGIFDDAIFASTMIAPPATIEERVASIENELQRQADAAAEKREFDAQKPSFEIGGQLQIDYLWFSQDDANIATVGDVPDAIDFRRARFVARGEAFETLEYMIGFDFALAGRPSFLDVWVGAKDLPYLGHLRAGHFFEPFSLERVTQNQRNTFMELSLADAFTPARNVGIEAFDSIGDEERASWRVGWFAANSDNFGDQFTDTGGQALTARMTWLPMWYDEGRAFMHLGAGYSYRTPPNDMLMFATTPEARPGAPGPTNIPNFVDTGIILADHHQLLGAEWALVYGPLYIQTEYIAVPVDQLNGPNLYFDGAYVNVSYFLTGESRTYNKLFGILDRVFPFENFFRVRTEEGPIVTGKGAWEFAGRYSFIDLDDANIDGGRLHNYTIGLNWYLNAYTRMKWELIQSNLDRAPVGESQAYIAGMRFDIDF
jgi:phosphate-selective porin OprO/OprP